MIFDEMMSRHHSIPYHRSISLLISPQKKFGDQILRSQ